jgi:hypothetical protein
MRSSGCDHGIEAPRCLQAPPPAWRAKGAEPGCRRIGDRLALHSAHQNINLSYRDLPYRDLPSRSNDPAAGLLAHGLKPGNRIGSKAHGQGPQLEFVSGIRQPPGYIYNRVKRRNPAHRATESVNRSWHYYHNPPRYWAFGAIEIECRAPQRHP